MLRRVVPLEQCREIATAVNDTNDCDVRTRFPIEDQAVADRKRTNAGTKVVASASSTRMFSRQVESLYDQLHRTIGDFDIAVS